MARPLLCHVVMRMVTVVMVVLAGCGAPGITYRSRDTIDADGPRKQPGLVAWHDSRDGAITAAGRSGRPVMLFQLLGDLDRGFC